MASKRERRGFFKFLASLAVVLTSLPFVPVGGFLVSPSQVGGEKRQPVIDVKRGRQVNAKDVPENTSLFFVYPRTGKPELDNDPFRQFVLIHLPKDLATRAGREFVSYSRICVHLWCLWAFRTDLRYPDGRPKASVAACPCHGSQYDPATGVAVEGPAFFQAPPNNVLPELLLEVDKEGGLWATELQGSVGIGRSLPEPLIKQVHTLYNEMRIGRQMSVTS